MTALGVNSKPAGERGTGARLGPEPWTRPSQRRGRATRHPQSAARIPFRSMIFQLTSISLTTSQGSG